MQENAKKGANPNIVKEKYILKYNFSQKKKKNSM